MPAKQDTQVKSLVRKILWRREWVPIAISLPGEFHGQRSLAGYSLWGHKELDMTERLTHKQTHIFLRITDFLHRVFSDTLSHLMVSIV